MFFDPGTLFPFSVQEIQRPTSGSLIIAYHHIALIIPNLPYYSNPCTLRHAVQMPAFPFPLMRDLWDLRTHKYRRQPKLHRALLGIMYNPLSYVSAFGRDGNVHICIDLRRRFAQRLGSWSTDCKSVLTAFPARSVRIDKLERGGLRKTL